MEETNDLVHASREDDELVNGLMLVTYRPYIGSDKGYDWRLFVTQLGDNDGGRQAMFGLQTARPIFLWSLWNLPTYCGRRKKVKDRLPICHPP